ncbi:MAG: AEC family transporter [Spirochaetaceae bacterium]|nr:AEC family transporter [Spirochaetaceae bacterium]
MNNVLFALNAVMPVFLLIVTGVVLKKISVLDDQFISKSTRLVFKVALPALIFQKISRADFRQVFDGKEILFIFLIVTGSFLLILFLSGFFIQDGAQRGAFVQGAFRSNIAIVGLAIITNVFGETGAARTAMALVFIFPMYNIYGVLAMVVPLKKGNAGAARTIFRAIATNPLIIAVLVALPFSIFSINTGNISNTFLEYLSKMTLPLALLGVGGSLSFSTFKKGLFLALSSSIIKLIIYPVIVVFILIAAGFREESLGVIFIMLASPSAVSSYVMAKSMGSDSDLAAGIILITTLGSIFTIGLGIFLMKNFGVI